MSDAIKIDAGSVKRCKLPPPSAALFEKMAKAALLTNGDSGILFNHITGEPVQNQEWEKSEDTFREALIVEAQAMYAVIATEAGALVERIPDDQRATKLKGGTA